MGRSGSFFPKFCFFFSFFFSKNLNEKICLQIKGGSFDFEIKTKRALLFVRSFVRLFVRSPCAPRVLREEEDEGKSVASTEIFRAIRCARKNTNQKKKKDGRKKADAR